MSHNNLEMEIKGQLLSTYLRQKEWALRLNNMGKSYDGCKILETLANDLILDEFREIEEALKGLTELRRKGDVYRREVIKLFADGASRNELRYRYMNRIGRPYFFKLNRAINKIMKEEKFYQIILKGGRPPTKRDDTLSRLLEI